jgi:hypothetical protein
VTTQGVQNPHASLSTSKAMEAFMFSAIRNSKMIAGQSGGQEHLWPAPALSLGGCDTVPEVTLWPPRIRPEKRPL